MNGRLLQGLASGVPGKEARSTRKKEVWIGTEDSSAADTNAVGLSWPNHHCASLRDLKGLKVALMRHEDHIVWPRRIQRGKTLQLKLRITLKLGAELQRHC
jgi:hypothetical protein